MKECLFPGRSLRFDLWWVTSGVGIVTRLYLVNAVSHHPPQRQMWTSWDLSSGRRRWTVQDKAVMLHLATFKCSICFFLFPILILHVFVSVRHMGKCRNSHLDIIILIFRADVTLHLLGAWSWQKCQSSIFVRVSCDCFNSLHSSHSLTIVADMGYFNTKIASLSRHSSLKLNFYRVHIIYFLLTIILSSIIMYGSGVNGNSGDTEASFKLRYIDAIFLCTSSMTNTGLNTVNLNDLTGFQQSILFVLALIGNVTVTANATIWIRRHFFRKYMKVFLTKSKAAREIVEEIDQEKGRLGSLADGPIHSASSGIERQPGAGVLQKVHSSVIRGPKSHHEISHGGIPYPWQWGIGRKIGSKLTAPATLIPERLHHYLSFQPSYDQKVRPSTLLHDLSLKRVGTLSLAQRTRGRGAWWC